jgi:N-formylglutamate deformylase
MSFNAAVSYADDWTAGDPVLLALLREPFSIVEPAGQATPFVFASPHSGRLYPQSFLDASCLDSLALRRSEDAFVDELFACVPQAGATFLTAHFPRAYVDVNRAESEIDPAMFDGPLPLPVGARSARVSAGLGVIPKVVRDGVEIYRRRLPPREAAFRMEVFYRPYHAALARLIDQVRSRFGVALVIDCHSMPPTARGHDVVLGDCHGEAASRELSAFMHETLISLGFSVGRNAPYAGGHTTSLYGKPASGAHAVQIEINRGLYLDERRMEKTCGYADCQVRIARFVAALVGERDLWRLAPSH